MNEDYCSYELSKALKAVGFDEPCHYHYDCDRGSHIIEPNYTINDGEGCQYITADDLLEDNNAWQYCSAPTLAHAQKWLREKKGIAINAIAHDGGRYHTERIILPNCMLPESRNWYVETTTPMVYSYEQALSEGIKSALELIKKVE